MKKSTDRFLLLPAAYKSPVLSALLALALVSCEKSPNPPDKPGTPPKPQAALTLEPPQAALKAVRSDIQKAVFTYSSLSASRSPNGQVVPVRHAVIRT